MPTAPSVSHWRRRCMVFVQFLAVVVILENLLLLYKLHGPCDIECQQRLRGDINFTVGATIGRNVSHILRSTTSTTTTAATTTSTPTTTTPTPNTTTTSRTTTKKQPPKRYKDPLDDPEYVKKLEEDYYKKRPMKVNPFHHQLRINASKVCTNDTYMIIIVHSLHSNVDRRAAIRKTWGSVAYGQTWPFRPLDVNIRLVFSFGVHKQENWNKVIREESDKYGDVIQGDFTEDYKNMTLKSLLELRWIDQYCNSAKYHLKSDDDMFINLPYLVLLLKNNTMPPRSIMGPFNSHSKIYRTGKWALSRKDFPLKFYPPYESGAAYVISADIIRELYETAEYVPQFHVDDAYITGVLAKILEVTHVKQYGFAYAVTKRVPVCDFVNNVMITGTKMTPTLLTQMWEKLVKGECVKTS